LRPFWESSNRNQKSFIADPVHVTMASMESVHGGCERLNMLHCLFAVSEFASLASQDPALSLNSELFDGQLENTSSVKQESDVLESLSVDAFDLAGFANANTACGTTAMYTQNVLNKSSIVTAAGVQNSPVDSTAPQLQFILQQPQTPLTQNAVSTISVADLLRAQEVASVSNGTSLQLPTMSDASTVSPTLDLTSPVTLELLAQAGIHQPVKRQIQLHSELAQHITTQKPLQVTMRLYCVCGLILPLNIKFCQNGLIGFRDIVG